MLCYALKHYEQYTYLKACANLPYFYFIKIFILNIAIAKFFYRTTFDEYFISGPQ